MIVWCSGEHIIHIEISRLGKLLLACTASLLLASPAEAQWSFYEETSIPGRISGSIRNGHIFKTRSGHIYEVADYIYLYEYEYSPNVIVLSDGARFKLIIDGFDEPLVCRCLNCGQSRTTSSSDSPLFEEQTIKSVQATLTALGFDPGTIDGTFNPQTRSALKSFRMANNLVATDSLDATILLAMADALTKKFPDKSEVLTIAINLLKAAKDWPQSQDSQELPAQGTIRPRVIESNIISEFRGLNYGNIYKLANGQIWEQTEPYIWIWIGIYLPVTIWNEGGIYRMIVSGIDHPVMVRRIN